MNKNLVTNSYEPCLAVPNQFMLALLSLATMGPENIWLGDPSLEAMHDVAVGVGLNLGTARWYLNSVELMPHG